jgi:exopolyphosphatase / guanosine-5'-triphosphate,3'-diphosphate pyrophosphatase
MAKRTAVIDIGSNSVRMVVFEKTSRFAFTLLHESKSRVRISEGAYCDDGNLQSAAIDRAVSALKEFCSIAHAYDSRKLLCIATSAVRDAPNRAFFLKRVREEVGLNIKVIDGEKEAYLGGVACAGLLYAMKARTIDIGGGSTECACIEDGGVTASMSLDLGTVRLKELFFDRGDIEGATAYIDAQLAALPVGGEPVVVGIGGTFRALAQIIMKMQHHPVNKLHGFTFTAAQLFALGEKILAARNDHALKTLYVKKERYDVIRPGTLILMRFLKHVGCETLVTSGAGVREGLYLTDLLRHNRHRFPEGFNPSLRHLLDRHTVEPKFANQLTRVTLTLFDLLQEPFALPQESRRTLGVAAKLAKVGASVHFYSYHKNSQYLVESALEYGYTHREIVTVAALVRYHKSKKIGKSYYAHYKSLLPDLKRLNRMNMILALSDTLLAHRPRDIDFRLALEDGVLVVTPQQGSSLYLAREKLKGLGIGKELKVRFA